MSRQADPGQVAAAYMSQLTGQDVRCMCVCCRDDVDPHWDLAVYRAPDNGECWSCGRPEREREGFVFVVFPVVARASSSSRTTKDDAAQAEFTAQLARLAATIP